MRRQLPRPQPGDYLTAGLLNAIYDEIARLDLTVGDNGNLSLSKGRGGMTLAARCPERFWAKITSAAVTLTGGAKAYAWTEQIPDLGGAWVDSDRTGTTTLDGGGSPIGDPAIESNRTGTVPLNAIVMAQRENGVLGFIWRSCT